LNFSIRQHAASRIQSSHALSSNLIFTFLAPGTITSNIIIPTTTYSSFARLPSNSHSIAEQRQIKMSFPVFDDPFSFERLRHEFESIKDMDAYRTALEDVSSETP
jgi:hypothetical protein